MHDSSASIAAIKIEAGQGGTSLDFSEPFVAQLLKASAQLIAIKVRGINGRHRFSFLVSKRSLLGVAFRTTSSALGFAVHRNHDDQQSERTRHSERDVERRAHSPNVVGLGSRWCRY